MEFSIFIPSIITFTFIEYIFGCIAFIIFNFNIIYIKTIYSYKLFIIFKALKIILFIISLFLFSFLYNFHTSIQFMRALFTRSSLSQNIVHRLRKTITA